MHGPYARRRVQRRQMQNARYPLLFVVHFLDLVDEKGEREVRRGGQLPPQFNGAEPVND